jgi:hypothetical protein
MVLRDFLLFLTAVSSVCFFSVLPVNNYYLIGTILSFSLLILPFKEWKSVLFSDSNPNDFVAFLFFISV